MAMGGAAGAMTMGGAAGAMTMGGAGGTMTMGGAGGMTMGGAGGAVAMGGAAGAMTMGGAGGGGGAAGMGGIWMPPVDEPPVGVAIISSDDTTSALSLAGFYPTAVTKDACVHSGTVSPKITVPWSNHLRISSGIQRQHEIAVIDRKSATVTRVAGTSCDVLQQMTFHQGFDSSPFDFVGGLPEGKSYVTRSAMNPANAAQGGDVLVLDSAGGVRGRIDLSNLVPAGAPAGKPWQPFPKGAILHKGKVYVVLGIKSADDTSFGTGVIAVIDPSTDTVSSSIPLPTRNCGAIQPYLRPDSKDHFVVACTGVLEENVNHAWTGQGVVHIDLSTNSPTLAADVILDTHLLTAGYGNEEIAAYSGTYVVLLKGSPQRTSFDIVSLVPDHFGPPNNGSWENLPFYGTASVSTRSFRVDPVNGHIYVTISNPPAVHIIEPQHRVRPGDERSFVANPSGGRAPRQLGFY